MKLVGYNGRSRICLKGDKVLEEYRWTMKDAYTNLMYWDLEIEKEQGHLSRMRNGFTINLIVVEHCCLNFEQSGLSHTCSIPILVLIECSTYHGLVFFSLVNDL